MQAPKKRTKWVQLDLIDIYAYERVKGDDKCDRSNANRSTNPKAPSASSSSPARPKPPTPQ